MRWPPACGWVGILAVLALGCGDDDRPGGSADMFSDGSASTDLPPRTDSGAMSDMDRADLDRLDMSIPDLGGDGTVPDMGIQDLGGDGAAPDMGVPDLGTDGEVPEMGIPDLGADGDVAEMSIPDIGSDGEMPEMGIPDLGGDGAVSEMGVPDLGTDGGLMDMGTDGGGGTADLGPGVCSASVACPATDFCDFPAGDICGDAGGTGTCRTRPMFCPLICDPHCGCDGVTHGNACEANAAGTDTRSRGACPP